MSIELDRILNASRAKSITDTDEIAKIIDDFVNTNVYDIENSEKKSVLKIVTNCYEYNYSDEKLQSTKVYDLVNLLAKSIKHPGFQTELASGFCDKKRYPNFLACAFALRLRNKKKNPYVLTFRQLNFESYMDFLCKNMSLSEDVDRKSEVDWKLNRVYELKKQTFPSEKATLGEVLDQLISFSTSCWVPGVQEINEYEKLILYSNDAIFKILINLLHKGYCGSL